MTKCEERGMVKDNRKSVYLETWAKEKAHGVSLSDFCKAYGLRRKNFYTWRKYENKVRSGVSSIVRVDPKLKAKAIEIYLRYKGTWCAETISMALKGMLSVVTIRKIIAPHRRVVDAPITRKKPESCVLKNTEQPNAVWSVDWTEYKIHGKKVFYRRGDKILPGLVYLCGAG